MFSPEQLQQYQMSYSEDSAPIELEVFFLGLFETDGSLPLEPSIMTVQDALNEFLITELNAVYDQNTQIDQVNSLVLTQANAASSRRRNLQVSGSQLETQVNIVFDHEPSPDAANVESTVQNIMEGDLTPLLNNITSRVGDDQELANVNSVYYLRQLPDPENNESTVGTPIESEHKQATVSESFLKLEVLIPMILACCVVITLVALFTARKRRRDVANSIQEMQEVSIQDMKEAELEPTKSEKEEVNLFWTGSENNEDFSSVEASLVASPQSASASTQKDTTTSSGTPDNYSDVFSDLGNESACLSPKTGDSRSVFSFLSGFASRGEASTVVASNVTKPVKATSIASGSAAALAASSPSGTYSGTPRSRVSSLFTFSEEDSEDLYSSSDEKANNNNNRQLKSAPSDEQTPSSTPANGVKSPDLVALTTIAAGATSALAVGAALNAKSNDNKADESASPDTNNKELLFSSTADDEKKTKNNLTTDQIKYELQAAEEAHRKSLSVGTKDTSSPVSKFTRCFSLKKVAESPAAKSYNPPQTETSPASESGYNTDPGPDKKATKVVRLQWDSPGYAPVSGKVNKTVASGSTGLSSAEARVRQLTGSKVAKKKQNQTSNVSVATADTGATSGGARLQQLTAAAAVGTAIGAGVASNSGAQSNAEETPSNGKGRRSSMTPGAIDGTAEYQNDAASMGSLSDGSKGSLSFRRGKGRPLSSEEKAKLVGSPRESDKDTDGEESPSDEEAKRRRHAKSTTGDGTKNYQNETMGEWSIEGDGDEPSLESKSSGGLRRRKFFGRRKSSSSAKPPKSPKAPVDAGETPKSAATNASTISGLSQNSPSTNSEASASKQLISDLLWLEQKISKTNQAAASSPAKNPSKKTTNKDEEGANGEIGPSDSMSFASGDGLISTDGDSTVEKSDEKESSRSFDESTFSSIVCRDCYAPPGKLKIVIHSTKDGPAVHTVKKGSTLEGHIFPGDLIISVDNVDTRSYSAEQVMKMMTAKTRFERKITVLHFEDVAKVE